MFPIAVLIPRSGLEVTQRSALVLTLINTPWVWNDLHRMQTGTYYINVCQTRKLSLCLCLWFLPVFASYFVPISNSHFLSPHKWVDLGWFATFTRRQCPIMQYPDKVLWLRHKISLAKLQSPMNFRLTLWLNLRTPLQSHKTRWVPQTF